MIVLNIESVQPLAEFNERMEALITQIKSVPLAQGFDEVFLSMCYGDKRPTKDRSVPQRCVGAIPRNG